MLMPLEEKFEAQPKAVIFSHEKKKVVLSFWFGPTGRY
jgi:hypothetical protein